ncbi:MAG: hypothetical protein NZ765_08400 [Anaerolineae bacterium]|nr:hypothetical protein [Anaerolineae bacterium]MDW8071649.1 hypothetical protein [Anaerolineae bacterium]
MKTRNLFVLSLALLVFAAACNLTSLIPGGGSAGTVSTLWADVPPFAGATRENIDLPLPARIALQAMLRGQLEFIVYTTPQPVQAVKDFYTKERMAASGWDVNQSAGCDFAVSGEAGEAQSPSPIQDMCFFTKREGNREVGLVILLIRDDQAAKTQIFYARVNLQATPEPGGALRRTPAS